MLSLFVIAFLSVNVTALRSEYPVDTSTVALFHFNEPSGRTTKEEVSQKSASVVSAQFGPGLVEGNGLKFNGGYNTRQGVQYVRATTIPLTSSLTVEAVIKVESDGPVVDALYNYYLGTNKGKVVFGVFDRIRGFRTVTSQQVVAKNVATHIAGTYNAQTGEMAVYIDGIKDNSVVVPIRYRVGGNLLMIGQVANFVSQFKGVIDEVRVSNVVRTNFDLVNYGVILPKEEGVTAVGEVDVTTEDQGENVTVTITVDAEPVLEVEVERGVDLSGVKVEVEDSRVAVRGLEGREHYIFVPDTNQAGVYVCPFARTLADVKPNCAVTIGYTDAQCKSGTTWCTYVEGKYKVQVYGTGAGENEGPALCGNGIVDTEENCLTCAVDVACQSGMQCSATGVCQICQITGLNTTSSCSGESLSYTFPTSCGQRTETIDCRDQRSMNGQQSHCAQLPLFPEKAYCTGS